jgi:hypothetical protein
MSIENHLLGDVAELLRAQEGLRHPWFHRPRRIATGFSASLESPRRFGDTVRAGTLALTVHADDPASCL